MSENKVKLLGFEADMRRQKEEALVKGEFTDFSFLVGEDDDKAELMYCFKSDLQVSSKYWRNVLTSPLTGHPIRIIHIQPHIFKLFLRFISFNKLEEFTEVEKALDLLEVAQEYQLENLKPFCLSEIERMVTVKNVWSILDEANDNLEVYHACTKVLSTRTIECLEDPSFYGEASPAAVLYLVNLDALNIQSEMELFNACLKFSKHELEFPTPEDGIYFLKDVLPHLRLLTLKPDEMKPELLNLLSLVEKVYLLNYVCTKMNTDEQLEAVCAGTMLNPNYSRRKLPEIMLGKQILQFIPDELIFPEPSVMAEPKFFHVACHSSVAFYSVKNTICLSGIDIFTPISKNLLFASTSGAADHKTRIYPLNEVDFALQVEVSYGYHNVVDTTAVFFSQKYQKVHNYYSWFHLKFSTELIIPKGTSFIVSLSVEERNAYMFRCYNEAECQLINDTTIHAVESHAPFSYLKFGWSQKSQNYGCETRNNNSCLMIKSVHYNIVE